MFCPNKSNLTKCWPQFLCSMHAYCGSSTCSSTQETYIILSTYSVSETVWCEVLEIHLWGRQTKTPPSRIFHQPQKSLLNCSLVHQMRGNSHLVPAATKIFHLVTIIIDKSLFCWLQFSSWKVRGKKHIPPSEFWERIKWDP